MTAPILATTPSLWALYQPLVVGLGAVVFATVGNTFLEWWKAAHIEKRTARTLRRALLEELRISQRSARNNRDLTEGPPNEKNIQAPVWTKFPIYESAIDKIGVLKGKEIGAVVNAYGYLNAMPELMVKAGELKTVEGVTFGILTGDLRGVLKKAYRQLDEHISEAIRVLEKGDM